jgi:hypothetical protein
MFSREVFLFSVGELLFSTVIPVVVTGIQRRGVCRVKESLAAQTRRCWIPATRARMTEKMESRIEAVHPPL